MFSYRYWSKQMSIILTCQDFDNTLCLFTATLLLVSKMNSLVAVVVLVISLGLCQGADILERVDNVLQNLITKSQLPQSDGSELFDEELFLDHANQFKSFVVEHSRNYETDYEIEHRFNIFRNNLKEIDQFNELELGTAVYGVTQFTDLTLNEFKEEAGLTPVNLQSLEKLSQEHFYNVSVSHFGRLAEDLSVDYRKKGKILEKVQNQRLCGSCWAHAATATIESAHAIKHNELIELSKQQIIDCDDNNGGCCGGWPFAAYEYVKDVGGIMAEKDYKQRIYEGKCVFNKDKVKAKVDKYYILYSRTDPSYNEYKYEKYLSDIGPLVAIMNADGLRYYQSGVINQPYILCPKSTSHLNHALTNVGFGTEVIGSEKYPYWIIKNSWGKSWGEQGYLRITRRNNICGVGWIATGVVAE